MVPIAIGLNINWVAIGDRFNLYHVVMYLGIMSVHFWFCLRARDKPPERTFGIKLLIHETTSSGSPP